MQTPNKIFTVILISISFLFLKSCLLQKNHDKRQFYNFTDNNIQIQTFDFQLIKTDTFPQVDRIRKAEFIKTEQGYKVVFLGIKTNNITILDLQTKEIKKINPFPNQISKIIDFGYINDDSIFIILNVIIDYQFNDSALLLCNSKGEILKKYNFDDAPVATRNNYLHRNQDSVYCVTNNLYEPFNFYKNKIFVHLMNKAPILGDTVYKMNNIAGYVDTKADTFHLLNISYPDVDYGKSFLPYEFVFSGSIIDKNGRLIFSFPNTPKLQIFDIEQDKYYTKTLKSKVIDTIYPSNKASDVQDPWQFDFPMYGPIFFDEYRNYYYRIISLPKEFGKTHLMLIADTNFNYFAEGFPPKLWMPGVFFTDEYFIAFGETNDKKLLINYYTLHFRPTNTKNFIATINSHKHKNKKPEKNIGNYFYEITGYKLKNYTYTVIFYDNMCASIRDFIFKHYAANEKKYQKFNTFLFIVTGSDPQKISELLSDYNLEPDTHKNIIIDSNLIFVKYNYFKTDFYPRVVKVRNNKVVLDSLFTTQENIGELWQDVLLDATREQINIFKH